MFFLTHSLINVSPLATGDIPAMISLEVSLPLDKVQADEKYPPGVLPVFQEITHDHTLPVLGTGPPTSRRTRLSRDHAL